MLKDLKFRQYTSSELKPSGWLKRQLEIQANGLSGNLDKFWPDIKDSKWIGGDKEGWERVPYWLDGFIPLAWLLDDSDMKSRAKKYIDAILDRQDEDGWICPCEKSERNSYDVWAFFLIAKVLVLYYECSGDERIEDALYRAMKCLDRHIENSTLFNWGSARWYECLIPLFWLYERRPESWMEFLAIKLNAEGIDYKKVFNLHKYKESQGRNRWNYITHVVNLAMCIKSEALMSRLTGENPNTFAQEAIKTLNKYHGMANGHFTGDECLAGTSPIHGSECCSVAEVMYSYEWLIALTGNDSWCDRLEQTAFNTFPATTSPDMWTHQYDQMTNQIECSILSDENKPFFTNSGESHLFGLEPNYGCCTANFNQAWPKFALSTMMKSEDGIAVTAIAPSELTTEIDGKKVTVRIVTDYPFEDGYKIIVSSSSPVKFALDVRIPSTAVNTLVNGEKVENGFYKIEKEWSAEEEISVSFSFEAKLFKRPNGLYCLKRGPLLYSLPVGERKVMHEYEKNGVERKFPYCDYELFPTTKWNYAFAGNKFTFEKRSIGEFPFSNEEPPVVLYADMAEVDWKYDNGKCAELPESSKAIAKKERIALYPYGCTNLRMTEMPKAKK